MLRPLPLPEGGRVQALGEHSGARPPVSSKYDSTEWAASNQGIYPAQALAILRREGVKSEDTRNSSDRSAGGDS
jgi:hypothetical protein